ncbi:hypothetical protein [Actinoplanes sp. GCM10030250]|uniref:hypothetical protein n=1 Tax=Actinoplanes sp. GCM10030250 TaxID=3273376 RepID=UPI0036091AB0
MTQDLMLRLSEDGADAERVDKLTGYLRGELVQLEVDDVRRAPAGEAPVGSRAFDPAMAGALLVSLGSSAESLRQVVQTVQGWLGRGRGGVRRTVRLELGGDVLELSEVSETEQQRLVDLFVRRHAAEDDADAAGARAAGDGAYAAEDGA